MALLRMVELQSKYTRSFSVGDLGGDCTVGVKIREWYRSSNSFGRSDIGYLREGPIIRIEW